MLSTRAQTATKFKARRVGRTTRKRIRAKRIMARRPKLRHLFSQKRRPKPKLLRRKKITVLL